MKTFFEAIGDIEIKKVFRNRLQLAFQSVELGRGMINVFSPFPFIDTLLPFQAALPFAARKKEHFEFWFFAFQERACMDLLDMRGNLNLEMQNLLYQHGSNEYFSDAIVMKKFTQSVLQAYCQHFMAKSIAEYAHEPLSIWWKEEMDLLAVYDFETKKHLENLMQLEWQQLTFLWRWVQYCAQNVTEDPVRFCVSIEYFYYAIHNYLCLNRNLPFSEEKMLMILEKIVADVGFIALEGAQASVIAGLYNTFYQISKNKIPAWLLSLFKKYSFLSQVAEYQASLIGQFFILGVMLNDFERPQMNIHFLIRHNETHPAAMQFLQNQSRDYFFHKFPINCRKTVIQSIKEIFERIDFQSNTLLIQIQEAIKIRQALSYWLKFNAEQWPSLERYFSDAMAHLCMIDTQLKNYSVMLNRMKWVKPYSVLPVETIPKKNAYIRACHYLSK